MSSPQENPRIKVGPFALRPVPDTIPIGMMYIADDMPVISIVIGPGTPHTWETFIPGAAVGPPDAVAYFSAGGLLTGDASFVAIPVDAFQRPCIRDFRLGPTLRGAVHKLGAWAADGDPQNVTSEGFVTYGANALGAGPSPTDGGLGFYTPNSWGALQIINGINGNNLFYSGGFEDGGPTAPFGIDGFIINDNLATFIAYIKRSTGLAGFRRLAVKEGVNAMAGIAVLGPGATIPVANTSVTATSRVVPSYQPSAMAPGGPLFVESITPAVGFVLTSASPLDAGQNVYWQIYEPA